MLNLLFISDSHKAEHIKSALQPVLKVIIDVVTDFDHGLKDVFEKRPTTVCIQDQIGGVTGESVARHIQMLLGNSAPTFILLHAGSSKAKTIKGLYEHIIDLNQSDDSIIEEIQNTLKSLLGDQWDKIFIPPKQTPASIRSSVAVPEESREDADKLVDDFLSDLETSGFSVAEDVTPVISPVSDISSVSPAPVSAPLTLDSQKYSEANGSEEILTSSDKLVELLQAEVVNAARADVVPAPFSAVTTESPPVSIDSRASAAQPAANPITSEPVIRDKPALSAAVHTGIKPVLAADSALSQSPPPAAEFRVSQNAPLVEEPIPEDLLLAFEENYRSESQFFRRGVVLVLVCIVCAAGGWYLVRQKPQMISSFKQRLVAAVGKRPITPPVPTVAAPAQKTLAPPAVSSVQVVKLPTFIPKEGHDPSYAAKNPGWERYVSKTNEFRVFTASGRIKAIQVLAVQGEPVSGQLLKSVLQEFAGSAEYHITSHRLMSGVRVENGTIKDKGEVIIYRKKGSVKAFVVSIN